MSEDIDQKLLLRFEIIQKIRKSSSGIIWKAIDRKTKELVAIKKVTQSLLPLNLLNCMRETLILQELPKHPNIIRVLLVIQRELDFYIVYEFVEMDLSSLIKVSILELKHIQLITYNIACTLYYMHQGGMVHLNLAPTKVLVDQDCQIKLIGFGLSQLLPTQQTPYSKLHYQAPELLLQGKITAAADIWALGCILGEMLSGQQLFVGQSALQQLERIVELTGKPTECYESQAAEYILQAIQSEKKKSFNSISTDATALDLLRRMLAFNPKERINITDLLKHAFFTAFFNPADLKKPSQQFMQFEELSLKGYQEMMRERTRKMDPSFLTSINQIESIRKKQSMKEITPTSLQRIKTKKQSSPIQSPIEEFKRK